MADFFGSVSWPPAVIRWDVAQPGGDRTIRWELQDDGWYLPVEEDQTWVLVRRDLLVRVLGTAESYCSAHDPYAGEPVGLEELEVLRGEIEELRRQAGLVEEPQAPAQPDRSAGLHRCPDWDFMLIGPDDSEWECCTCAEFGGKGER